MSSLVGLQAVSAQSDASAGSSGLIDKLASTFHLSKDEVKNVFDQYHSEQEQQMEVDRSERLQKLVDDGTITSQQKTAIEAKLAELKKEREAHKDSFKDQTPAARKAEMEKHRSELEAWAKAQNLDLTKLQGIFGGPGMGHGDPRMDRPEPTDN